MAPSAVVVGGGITGLVAAYRLAEHCEVTLIEAAPQLGGKFVTHVLDGARVEAGPDSFLTRDERAVRLCHELGLEDELIAPEIFGAHIWLPGGLKKLPSGFPYGFPASPWRARRAGILSAKGAVRASLDLVLPRGPIGPDVSVAEFVRHRFGPEVLAYLVDPLLAGTRAGRSDRLSLRAALPQIDSMARRHRSFIVGMRKAARSGAPLAGPPPFLSLEGGMRTLVDALASRLKGTVRTGSPVEKLSGRPGRYIVSLPDGEEIPAEVLVLAAPLPVTAKLLGGINERASLELGGVRYASVATVSVVFPPAGLEPPSDSSGLLVPSERGTTLAAATWFSRKWPHLAPPGGSSVVKCFVGRAGRERVLELADDSLIERVVSDLNDALGSTAEPAVARVDRWDRALPQYEIGHVERIVRAEAMLERTKGIAVAGAGLRGSGIPDCIASAETAVQRVLPVLSGASTG